MPVQLAPLRTYLERCIPSLNANKLHGMKAEAEFRNHISAIGAADRISPGGWIFRRNHQQPFGHDTVAVFPHTINTAADYSKAPTARLVPLPLHTICATMHQIGIRSFYAHPVFAAGEDPENFSWQFIQLGVPWVTTFSDVNQVFAGFTPRQRRYNYLRYHTDVKSLSSADVAVQFSHENLRIFVQSRFRAETSDIDAIVWGQRYTYPVEVKEKAVAQSDDIGEWFGLDTGPFVKLAHYVARRGNLHSLFIVREIADTKSRAFKEWLFTDFDQMARYASWFPQAGGKNMKGGGSNVVRIPRTAFRTLDAASFGQL